MATTYTVSKASPSDAHAIASIFAHSWTSPFTRLQFGHVDPSALAHAMAPGIVSQMQNPLVDFRVIRDLSDSEEVIAAAQWKLPEEDAIGEEDEETLEEKEERRQFEDDAYRNKLPDDSNKDLIMEFTVGLRGLRERTLGGRRHYRMFEFPLYSP
ncbi:hypothetical protein BU24DRAFT_416204 [Aaosphaeria arxii CBS 175.79]|uniref:N-acetyltransferase domain-containing protein n=1 Tax=Aaosphaeria arxii CBS 175.79 TaxID=1450172 RepID=A0A6A5Y4U0_9PLEO|nr:uncharacterized protein BU24DRAFT_416204 [Aaosphaeria arxii CBS 175.79]KAF2020528.1 hypothetical protein BU24DRAFT_416204 [Aaosphaeria arxii CBS 175.79]